MRPGPSSRVSLRNYPQFGLKAPPDSKPPDAQKHEIPLSWNQRGSGEMANTLALGASAERLRGSSPLFRTTPLPSLPIQTL